MAQLDYVVVDVFTDQALAGNPLAVVMDTVGLETARMQAIAREFNLSETTFIQRRSAAQEAAEGVRVRIFTTQEELPFAGHPTLGTASVLRKLFPDAVHDDTVRLALNVGPVPVRFQAQAVGSDALFGEMTQRDPEFGAELDRADVARLTGLAAEDIEPSVPPQVVSTGTAFAIVALRSSAGLARLKVNHDEATAYLRERGGAVVLRFGTGPSPKRGLHAVAGEDAVLRRRGPGDGLGRRVRHQLPGGTGTGSRRRTAPSPPGHRNRSSQRHSSVRAEGKIEGDGCAGGGQHCSCGKREFFGGVMHTLSTGIHLVNPPNVLYLAAFPTFLRVFHRGFSPVFPSFHEAPTLVLFRSIGRI